MKQLTALILSSLMGMSIISCDMISSSSLVGKPGEVLVVMNEEDWESPLGAMVRDSLTALYPMLPQAEQRFNLTNVEHFGFANMFHDFRNILIVDTKAKYGNKFSCRGGVWTPDQCVIELKAETYNEAIEMFQEKASAIIQTFEDAERDRIISNNEKYCATSVQHKVKKAFGGTPALPADSKIYKQTDDFMWISICNTDFIKKNILIYRYPIESEDEAMKVENILAHNLAAMNDNIPGMRENSYMTHSMYFVPTVEFIRHNDKNIAEIRGLWDVKNDYMGGPFMGHEFVSPDGKYMIGVTGFVYAPKYDKIQYLRDVEAIVYSFKFAGEEN